MKDVKIGIQLYAFRFEFAENPKKTLEDIKAMGYTGVEFPMGSITSLNEGLTDKETACGCFSEIRLTASEICLRQVKSACGG